MVKKADDRSDGEAHPLLPEHVGVDLWRAALAWRDRLHSEMVARGHAWYGDARSVVAQHLDPRGMSQAALVERIGLTKQAVQQLLDSLEEDGIVRREPDPNDGRAKRVVYTKRGLAALADAVEVKRTIEAEYEKKLGARRYEALVAALRALARE
jgi:DNA-binding MarR family transcriptional regulator